MMDTFWGLFSLVALVLVFIVPVVGIVALIKPSWFGRLGESRKRICLKLFGVWVVGCLMMAVIPTPEVPQATNSVQQEKAKPEAEKPAKKAKPSGLTLEQYNRIEMGMSLDDVKAITGNTGKVMSESDMAGYRTMIIELAGSGSLGANANITVQNGKVISKAQVGLK
jgi:hypothetical protein